MSDLEGDNDLVWGCISRDISRVYLEDGKG